MDRVAMPQIDPSKEVEAAEKRINVGLSTMADETIALTGGDFEDNFPVIARERDLLRSIGMPEQVGRVAAGEALVPPILPPIKEAQGRPRK